MELLTNNASLGEKKKLFKNLYFSKKLYPSLIYRDVGMQSAWSNTNYSDPRQLCAVSDGRSSIHLANIVSGKEMNVFREMHMSWINCLAFSPSNCGIYSTSGDQTVGYLDIEKSDGYTLHLSGSVADKIVSYQENISFFGCTRHVVGMWDLRDQKTHPIASVMQHNLVVEVIDENTILIGGSAGELIFWDLKMLKPLYGMKNEADVQPITDMELKNHNVLVNTRGNLLHFPDIDLFSPCGEIKSYSDYPGATVIKNNYNRGMCAKNCSLSNDGNFAFVGWDKEYCVLWDVSAGKMVNKIEIPEKMNVTRTKILDNGMFGITFEDSVVLHTIRPVPMKRITFIEDVVDEETPIEEEDHQEFIHQIREDNVLFDTAISGIEPVCSYTDEYIGQDVYVCMTCKTDGVQAGICEVCAQECHAGHNTVKIDWKNSFRCDCGNQKFENICDCAFELEKDELNTKNQYDHTFDNKYCYCIGEESPPMYMCVGCNDWFHGKCVDVPFEDEVEVQNLLYVCEKCIESNKASQLIANCEIYPIFQPSRGIFVKTIIKSKFGDTIDFQSEDLIEAMESEKKKGRVSIASDFIRLLTYSMGGNVSEVFTPDQLQALIHQLSDTNNFGPDPNPGANGENGQREDQDDDIDDDEY